MKQKKKNISKLSLKECLQKLINEDRNKVAEYFENIKQAASLLSQVKFDCPVITQDMRNEIDDIIFSIDELKTKWIDMGYVDRTDLSDVEFNYRYGDKESNLNRFAVNEDFPTHAQIKNVTGIYDDDMLNAAAEAERREKLEGSIARDLGGYRDRKVLYFPDVCELLKNKYGFDYERAYDEEQSHIFSNGNDELFICTEPYYPNQGKFRLRNLGVSEK